MRLIKMDIIGSEAKALLGMKKLVAGSPGLTLLSAFCPAFLRDAGTDPAVYLRALLNLGFAVYDITRGERFPVRDGDIPAVVRRYDPPGAIAQGELLCIRAAHQSK